MTLADGISTRPVVHQPSHPLHTLLTDNDALDTNTSHSRPLSHATCFCPTIRSLLPRLFDSARLVRLSTSFFLFLFTCLSQVRRSKHFSSTVFFPSFPLDLFSLVWCASDRPLLVLVRRYLTGCRLCFRLCSTTTHHGLPTVAAEPSQRAGRSRMLR